MSIKTTIHVILNTAMSNIVTSLQQPFLPWTELCSTASVASPSERDTSSSLSRSSVGGSGNSGGALLGRRHQGSVTAIHAVSVSRDYEVKMNKETFKIKLKLHAKVQSESFEGCYKPGSAYTILELLSLSLF